MMLRGAARPLAGIKAVEFGSEEGVRYCGRLLAALGAQVVRAGEGDPRDVSPGLRAFGAWLDEDKTTADGFAAAVELLGGGPDLVLAGQTPQIVETVDAMILERGLDSLRLGLSWFGAEGPYAGWRGDDALVQALIGIAGGFGEIEGPPMLPQGRAPQIVGGTNLFIAGLAALWGRRAGRETRRVDVNILEACLCFTETAPAGFEKSGGRSRRTGINRFAANHPMSVYETRDGWLGVTALTPSQWTALTDLAGLAGWGADPRFATSVERVARAEAIDEALRPIFRTRSTAEWLIEGQTRRIPLAPVPSHRELPLTPHWRERDAFAPVPGWTGVLGPDLPFRMSFDGHRDAAAPSGGERPLSRLRVVDFSMGWAGPLCTRHLADLGAEVIKIESEGHYDWWRGWEPPGASDPPQYELKSVFNVMNRGKLGVLLDLTTSDGAAAARQLVASADIVVENFAPGVMGKLGLGYEALAAVRPGLVMVSMGAFGATGPWSFFRAYGATVEQASGMPHANGRADWPPVLQHGAYGDPVAGLFAAVAVLTGLVGRARLGGSWADLAQVECLFQLGADLIVTAQAEGGFPRMGSRSPAAAPRCVSPAADGWVAVAVTDGPGWTALCEVLGRGDWAQDPRLATIGGRNAMAEEIETAIAAWSRNLTAAEAAAALQVGGVCAAPVVSSDGLTRDPQLMRTGAWTRIGRRHSGEETMAAPPFRFDGVRPAVGRPAPLLGEHSDIVLGPLRTEAV